MKPRSFIKENCFEYGGVVPAPQLVVWPSETAWWEPQIFAAERYQFFQSHTATPEASGDDATNMDKRTFF